MVAIDVKSMPNSETDHRRSAENRAPATRNHRQAQPLVNNLYQGMTLDAVTGQYYDRARDYSPSLGRWMEQDPAQFINGANTYQFVNSSPVGNVDADGRSVISVVGTVGGEIGPVGASVTGGFATDSSGNTGLALTCGIGGGGGFDEFSGVGGQVSTAPTLFNLAGGSADTSITAGAGLAGSITESVMNGPGGPIYSSTGEVGEGFGASFSPGASYTFVIPIPLRGLGKFIECNVPGARSYTHSQVRHAVEEAQNPYGYSYQLPMTSEFP